MGILNKGGVAVVIPAYNAEEYIADCLDSILAQTYSNWTIYCVNDGSRDHTKEISINMLKRISASRCSTQKMEEHPAHETMH